MVLHVKALVFILLLLFVISFSGCADGFEDGGKLRYPNNSNIQMMVRKLLGVDPLLDYEKPGSNTAHTPDGKDNSGKDAGGKTHKGGSGNNSSGKRSRDSSSSDITQQQEVSKRTKLVDNGERNGSISFDGQHGNQAFKIGAMKVYTAEKEEEQKLSTRLELCEDTQTIKKVLKASDANGSSRLVLSAHVVELTHHKENESKPCTENLLRVQGRCDSHVSDYDTNTSESELTLNGGPPAPSKKLCPHQ